MNEFHTSKGKNRGDRGGEEVCCVCSGWGDYSALLLYTYAVWVKLYAFMKKKAF